jgi:hypothetical protein
MSTVLATDYRRLLTDAVIALHSAVGIADVKEETQLSDQELFHRVVSKVRAGTAQEVSGAPVGCYRYYTDISMEDPIKSFIHNEPFHWKENPRWVGQWEEVAGLADKPLADKYDLESYRRRHVWLDSHWKFCITVPHADGVELSNQLSDLEADGGRP